jgi:DNA-directed RNA polymerase specialized sigma24 family protein
MRRGLLSGDRAEAEDVAQETHAAALEGRARLAAGRNQGDDLGLPGRHQPLHRPATVAGPQAADGAGRCPELADGAPGAEGQLIEAGRMAALEAALAASLPDRQRQAVVLRHLEGMTNPEIAAIMEIGVEAVESLTARGKRALSAILSGQKDALGYEDDAMQDDLDDLLATAARQPAAPSEALMERVLADALALQPQALRPARPPPRRDRGS